MGPGGLEVKSKYYILKHLKIRLTLGLSYKPNVAFVNIDSLIHRDKDCLSDYL